MHYAEDFVSLHLAAAPDAEATNHWFGPAAGARRATSLDDGATNHCLRLNVPVITSSSKDEYRKHADITRVERGKIVHSNLGRILRTTQHLAVAELNSEVMLDEEKAGLPADCRPPARHERRDEVVEVFGIGRCDDLGNAIEIRVDVRIIGNDL